MKKKIHLTDIINSNPKQDYAQLYDYILSEIEAGHLMPVKASGLNGRKPALYCSYWKLEKEADYRDLLEEMQYRLSPRMDMSYYLKNPGRYGRERKKILQLSEYLIQKKEYLTISETINERSFEIFQREKFLDREGGAELLSRLGLSMDKLNCYATSEPMSYYSHSKQAPQDFLIIENKDTFYSMRKHLIHGSNRILGLEVGTLIYGGGKGIYRSFEDFVTSVEPYFAHKDNQVWYFGDLDYEGILIYETLVRKYQEKCPVHLFTGAYEKMLNKAETLKLEQLPKTKEGQNEKCGDYFFSCFPEAIQKRIREILENGRYIPQEIINESDY